MRDLTESIGWDGGGWVDPPALEADVTADVCVVGLGGSGLAAVAEAQALGVRVIGVDAGADCIRGGGPEWRVSAEWS